MRRAESAMVPSLTHDRGRYHRNWGPLNVVVSPNVEMSEVLEKLRMTVPTVLS